MKKDIILLKSWILPEYIILYKKSLKALQIFIKSKMQGDFLPTIMVKKYSSVMCGLNYF